MYVKKLHRSRRHDQNSKYSDFATLCMSACSFCVLRLFENIISHMWVCFKILDVCEDSSLFLWKKVKLIIPSFIEHIYMKKSYLLETYGLATTKNI